MCSRASESVAADVRALRQPSHQARFEHHVSAEGWPSPPRVRAVCRIRDGVRASDGELFATRRSCDAEHGLTAVIGRAPHYPPRTEPSSSRASIEGQAVRCCRVTGCALAEISTAGAGIRSQPRNPAARAPPITTALRSSLAATTIFSALGSLAPALTTKSKIRSPTGWNWSDPRQQRRTAADPASTDEAPTEPSASADPDEPRLLWRDSPGPPRGGRVAKVVSSPSKSAKRVRHRARLERRLATACRSALKASVQVLGTCS